MYKKMILTFVVIMENLSNNDIKEMIQNPYINEIYKKELFLELQKRNRTRNY